MSGPLNLIKLCVGADTVDDLVEFQKRRAEQRRKQGLDPRPRHTTRMWPRRSEELLDGGSLYWVFRGVCLARQKIEALEEVIGEDGIRRCMIILAPEIVQVQGVPRRPFQGWRYLSGDDAPKDVIAARGEDRSLPPALALALDGIGVVARSS